MGQVTCFEAPQTLLGGYGAMPFERVQERVRLDRVWIWEVDREVRPCEEADHEARGCEEGCREVAPAPQSLARA